MENKRVSIVMCTYNGAKYVAGQLESILNQTYSLYEVIVQDDGSTDGTVEILHRYAARYPAVRICQNARPLGVNGNFYSAMRKASGDYIALSDQDDIWEPDKIAVQMAAIGDKMMCTGRSVPFSDDGTPVSYDKRRPNCNLIRLLYSSVPGHTLLFRRDMLEKLPADSLLYTASYYDVALALLAASYDSIVYVEHKLVNQRRYSGAASIEAIDRHRQRSASNAFYILFWSLRNYGRVKPCTMQFFGARLDFLSKLDASAPIHRDAVQIMRCHTRRGLLSELRLAMLFFKYRHRLFYTYERDPAAAVRALLYPLMLIYNYRYLLRLRK